MNRIEWDDSLSLGVEGLDEQHKEMVNTANLVLAAMEEEDGENIVPKVLQQLLDYCDRHFVAEEKFMREILYPRLAEHQREHNKLRTTIEGLLGEIAKQHEVTLKELRNVLSFWLISHILESDMAIAQFLHEKEAEAAAESE